MANRWLQVRLFTCVLCGDRLLHDRMYRHVCLECPKRPMSGKHVHADNAQTLATCKHENKFTRDAFPRVGRAADLGPWWA
jgi:hypothetical protein